MEDLSGVIQNAYTRALEDLAKKIEDSGRVIAPGADIEWVWDEQGTHLTATVDTIPVVHVITPEQAHAYTKDALHRINTPCIRWHVDPRKCSHSNDDVCRTCDFDGYYEATYPDCPWRTKDTS